MDLDILKQELIDYLNNLLKYFDKKSVELPNKNEKKSFILNSDNTSCSFSLDINRTGKLESKSTLQNRYLRTNDILVRIDINGPPHTNPNGEVTGRNHIHIYQEINGILTNIAYNLEDILPNLNYDMNNINKIFEEFCKYNNIKIPEYQLTL